MTLKPQMSDPLKLCDLPVGRFVVRAVESYF